MKRIFAGCLLLVLVLSACAGGNTEVKERPEAVTLPETLDEAGLLEHMDSGHPLWVVDARPVADYEAGHIPGAVSVPAENLSSDVFRLLPLLDRSIVVYGAGREQVISALRDMGYTDLSDLGDYDVWTGEVETGRPETPEKSGTLTSFAAYGLSGDRVDEGIFSGHKLTMVNIWATYCGPCLNEMPDLGELHTEYADRGMQIVGIVSDVPEKTSGAYDTAAVNKARDLVYSTGADYLHLLASVDLQQAVLVGLPGVPVTVFVDSEGNPVGESVLGAQKKSDWVKIIDERLAMVG